jgi:hypothetical protein
MKVMVMVKATLDSEAGVMPSEQLLADMGNFNEELVKAGILLTGEGLHPSSKGARVRFSGTNRSVIDGPFTETKELVAGFWIWQVQSMEEAIAWVKRCPNPMPSESEIEIRPLFEASDFGDEIQCHQSQRLRFVLSLRLQTLATNLHLNLESRKNASVLRLRRSRIPKVCILRNPCAINTYKFIETVYSSCRSHKLQFD